MSKTEKLDDENTVDSAVQDITNPAIALCLSGGGFRATLFHLGVVKALRDYATAEPALAGTSTPEQSPNPISSAALTDDTTEEQSAPREGNFAYVPALVDVAQLYSVSGGSILAAHMVLNWEKYTGSDADFAEVEKEILAFSQRNLRDRILRRWVLLRGLGIVAEWASRLPLIGFLLPMGQGLFGRTYWLQRQYDALFKSQTICDAANGLGPSHHILTTSFTTGQLCSFSDGHFDIETGKPTPASTPCGHLRLSFPVAASSAFPPMFPPIELDDDMLANPDPPDHFERLYLSDGGVFDNLGVEKFLIDAARLKLNGQAPPATLVVSDAGGSFRAGAQKTFGGIFSRNVRASDILMHRLADQAKAAVQGVAGYVPIRISTTCPDPLLDRAVQQRLRLVRTDFDRFGPQLAQLLIEHGERVTHEAMRLQHRIRMRQRNAIQNAPLKVELADRLASKAANRTFRSLALDGRDWTLIPLLLIAVTIVGSSFTYIKQSQDAKAAQRELQLAKSVAEQKNAVASLERARSVEEKFEKAGAAYLSGDMPMLERILFNGLRSASNEVQSDERSLVKAEVALSEVTAQSAAATPTAVTPIGETSVGRTQKVFIQFAGLLTRQEITQLNRTLKSQGWATQSTSGERTRFAAGLAQVRFSGSNGPAAQQLATAINDTGLLSKEVKPMPYNGITADTLEVWISQ